jgi:hypothetical protein
MGSTWLPPIYFWCVRSGIIDTDKVCRFFLSVSAWLICRPCQHSLRRADPSIRMEASPPWPVCDEGDQALRRPPTKSRLSILLSQASEFQERVDPTNAVAIFPRELCCAQLRRLGLGSGDNGLRGLCTGHRRNWGHQSERHPPHSTPVPKTRSCRATLHH